MDYIKIFLSSIVITIQIGCVLNVENMEIIFMDKGALQMDRTMYCKELTDLIRDILTVAEDVQDLPTVFEDEE